MDLYFDGKKIKEIKNYKTENGIRKAFVVFLNNAKQWVPLIDIQMA